MKQETYKKKSGKVYIRTTSEEKEMEMTIQEVERMEYGADRLIQQAEELTEKAIAIRTEAKQIRKDMKYPNN